MQGDYFMVMSKMIFVTGFARGGTSWLRDCIDAHPDIAKIPGEMVLFRDIKDRESIEQAIEEAILQNNLNAPFYVNKAPANAPYIGKACRLFPESKFIFIIRDPRDVFISHKRGKRKWMGGKNSTVKGCMEKIEKYYKGYLDARDFHNLLLVRYEDLHQDFNNTMQRVYGFIGVSHSPEVIQEVFKKTNFIAVAGGHKENRNSVTRKGVIGDWVNFLSFWEKWWYRTNKFWKNFLDTYGYSWNPPTYKTILSAMKNAGVVDLTEEDLLSLRLNPDSPNLLLLHDIDLLNTRNACKSVLETARIEGELGIASIFNFLPLDDQRYTSAGENKIIRVIHKIKSLSPRASIGLHLNAAERFFPAEMEDAGDDHTDMSKAVAYLHKQIDAYAAHGINFRVATAHGYGRAKKRPNNRDSYVFTEELEKRGIKLFDTTLRGAINEQAGVSIKFDDVGDPLHINDMPNNGTVDDPVTYRTLPPGCLIHFLTHPGNYDINRKLTLGVRLIKLL